MAIALNEDIRNDHLNNIRDKIDAGDAEGVLHIYKGTRPASGESADAGDLLGTCTFSDPSAPDASDGTLTFDSIAEDSSADQDGEASWARVEDSDGNWVMDMDVGTSGSGASLILNTTTIAEGGPIRIDSGEITAGNA